MKKITLDSISAFLEDRHFCRDNTAVKFLGGFECGFKCVLTLNGNDIAKKTVGQMDVCVSSTGGETHTTKERLNGIMEMLGKPRIYSRNFIWYWKDDIPFPVNGRFEQI